MYRAVIGEIVVAVLYTADGFHVEVPSNPNHVLTNNVYMSLNEAKEAVTFLVPVEVRPYIRWLEKR